MEVRVLILVAISAACFPAVVFCNTVTLVPDNAVIYQDDEAFFSCTPTAPITNILWTLNGTRVVANTTFVIFMAERLGSLSIRNVSVDYNNTIVQCTVTFSSGSSTAMSNNGNILVQGLLQEVGGLQVVYEENTFSLNISWTAPFALTVPPATLPEISYCVDIVNKTSSVVISGECGFNETSFVFNSVECGTTYQVVVLPVNIFGNGTNSTTVFQGNVNVSTVSRRTVDLGSDYEYTFPVVSGLACGCGVIEDLPGSLSCTVNDTSPALIVVTIGIPENIKFTIIITTINSGITQNRSISESTFDVRKVFLYLSQNNTANYSVEFALNSSAMGVLLIVLNIGTGGSVINFNRTMFIVQERERAKGINPLMNLTAGTYRVLAYDVESDGLLNSSVPAAESYSVAVPGDNFPGSIQYSFPGFEGCNVTVTDGMQAVDVFCNFTNFTNSVVDGYVVILQNIDLSRAGELDIGSTTDLNNPVTVRGVKNGRYCATVLTLTNSTLVGTSAVFKQEVELTGFTTAIPTEDTTTPYPGNSTSNSTSPSTITTTDSSIAMSTIIIIVVVILASIFLFVVLIVVVIIVCKCKEKKNDDTIKLSSPPQYTGSSSHEAELSHYSGADKVEMKVVHDLTSAGTDPVKSTDQMYETVQLKKPSEAEVVDEHTVEYAVLQHSRAPPPVPPPLKSLGNVSNSPPPHIDNTHGSGHLAAEDLYEALGGIADEWKEFAENLGCGEDYIDEVFTNNETNIGCFSNLLADLAKHVTKEKIVSTLKNMGHSDLAQKVLGLASQE